MRLLRFVFVVLTPALLFSLQSCYPGDSLPIEDFDVVATNFEPEYFDNTTSNTYHLPDTVGLLGGSEGDDPELDRQEMDFILAQVRRNMDALGWTEIPEIDTTGTNLPDVVVTVDAVTTRTTSVGCAPWWGWWGWYPWWPGWGWGPGGCFPTYVSSFTTGTVIINMIDTEESTEIEFRRPWNAGINGLVRNSNQGNASFVSSTIDQAFAQSPYLNVEN
jgi:hypothetical protein